MGGQGWGAQKAVGEDVNYTNKTPALALRFPQERYREGEWRGGGGGEMFAKTSERRGTTQTEGGKGKKKNKKVCREEVIKEKRGQEKYMERLHLPVCVKVRKRQEKKNGKSL